jgi:dihydrofolate synthase/folylpolyglutamate synthase
LGGRLDAVNLVDADCALITPIGLDHQEFLGPDLKSISAEKAGIIRPGAPVVCTESDPPMPIIRTAADLQAPLFHRGRHFDLVQAPGSDSAHLQFSLGDQAMVVSAPAMRGKHQCDNLATALAAFVLLNPGCMAKAAEISDAIVNCSLPGRIQQVSSSPDIFLDVGHNELAAEALSGFLGESGRFNTTCVLAMLADKPVEAVALVMKPFCQRWFCADSPGARGQSGERLAQRLKTVLPKADVDFYGPPGEAMEAALSNWETDQTILVFGSFSTVSAVADWLTNRRKQDGHDADRIIAVKSEIVPEKN